MLVLALIVLAELIVLFRLVLPDMLRFFEARHDAVYNISDADSRVVGLRNFIIDFDERVKAPAQIVSDGEGSQRGAEALGLRGNRNKQFGTLTSSTSLRNEPACSCRQEVK